MTCIRIHQVSVKKETQQKKNEEEKYEYYAFSVALSHLFKFIGNCVDSRFVKLS